MSLSAEITPKLKEHIGEHSAELIQLAYQSMDIINDVNLQVNVKNERTLTTLNVKSGAKPFKSTFEGNDDVVEFIPRKISVKPGKYETEFAPEEYRDTYLAQFARPGIAREFEDLPFSEYIANDLAAKFGEEVNDETAYFGVYNASGTTAAAIATGYGKIIADAIAYSGSDVNEKITPLVTGAITADDALEQLQLLYRNIPIKYRKPKYNLKAYMSVEAYEAYEDCLSNKGFNTGRGDDMLSPRYLRGTRGILELKPVSWMGNSGRIIMTPFANINMALDTTSEDMAKANIVQKMWTVEMGMAAAFGFDFAYLPLVWCNEQV